MLDLADHIVPLGTLPLSLLIAPLKNINRCFDPGRFVTVLIVPSFPQEVVGWLRHLRRFHPFLC